MIKPQKADRNIKLSRLCASITSTTQAICPKCYRILHPKPLFNYNAQHKQKKYSRLQLSARVLPCHFT
jgi:hypothetical protein